MGILELGSVKRSLWNHSDELGLVQIVLSFSFVRTLIINALSSARQQAGVKTQTSYLSFQGCRSRLVNSFPFCVAAAGSWVYWEFQELGTPKAARPGPLKIPRLYHKSKARYSLLMKSMISSKGQITVPVEIRNRLGLRPGTVVTFEMTPKGALLRKGGSGTHPVDELYGLLSSKARTDDLLDELRGSAPTKRRAKRR